MRINILTPDFSVPDETALVQPMLEHEAVVLHLRKPDASAKEYRQYLDSIPARLHHKIILHGAFELAKEYPVKGIHLNSHLRTGTALNELLATFSDSTLTLSSSFHNWEEIATTTVAWDAAFISPVFDSISKKGYKAAIPLHQCSVIQQQLMETHGHRPQILGLGGVDRHNIQQLHQNGFDGAVLLGSIWASEKPLTALNMLLDSLA
jgi:thiamine-phosphate pyrophosphorylase